jgi:nitrile hydratase subunit beta
MYPRLIQVSRTNYGSTNMNGIHDCGGMDGLGPIVIDNHEPVFHAEWERRAFALMWAAAANGFWNLDEFRYTIERMPAAEYLETPYYVHWMHSVETLLVEKGVIKPAELSGARHRQPNIPAKSTAVMTRDAVTDMLTNGFSTKKNESSSGRFKVGDRVRTKLINPHGHTRLPRYARNKLGVVRQDHGVFTFNDANAVGPDKPQHVYLVQFPAREIWGEGASDKDSLLLDLWDDHLTAAE